MTQALLDEIVKKGRDYRYLDQAEKALQNRLRALLCSVLEATGGQISSDTLVCGAPGASSRPNDAGTDGHIRVDTLSGHAAVPAAYTNGVLTERGLDRNDVQCTIAPPVAHQHHEAGDDPSSRDTLKARVAPALPIVPDAAGVGQCCSVTQRSDVLPAAPGVSQNGDHRRHVTQNAIVPAWLRKAPKHVPQANWHPEWLMLQSEIAPFLLAQCLAVATQKAALVKTLEACTRQLPIWAEWCAAIRGVDAFGLARILAETGDLWEYPTVAKFWKRMGVGLYNGEIQRRKKGITEEEAVGMAYSPRRRAIVYNLQIGLRNQNTTASKAKDGTPLYYRQLYLDRKQYEAAKAPTLRPGIWEKRAGRYMAKRFLCHLWVAWQQTMPRPAAAAEDLCARDTQAKSVPATVAV